MSKIEVIVNEYEDQKVSLSVLGPKIVQLIKDLADGYYISLHDIKSRIKEKESLVKKVQKKEGKYNQLSEITDVLGVRVITYFNDDVDKLAEIIKNEFDLDLENSVDKRVTDPDRFGYSSLHYIVSLKENRTNLTEYRHFKELKFEIQIRSILQHAWAEIEHDLGYKSQNEVPVDIRRDFSRVAGLLELADNEFLRIKSFLESYSSEIENKIKQEDLDVSIDKVTLEEYALSSIVVNEIIDKIIEVYEITESRIIKKTKMPGLLLDSLKSFNISTILELDSLLKNNKDDIIDFFMKHNESLKDTNAEISYDVTFIYLIYLLIYRNYNRELLTNFLKHYEIPNNTLENVIERFEKIVTERSISVK